MTYPEHAERLWSILIELSQSQRTETYAKIGERLGLRAQSVSGALAPIHAYCEQFGLPLLTVLVVQKETGRPGPGYKSANDLETDRSCVFARDWEQVRSPTVYELEMAARR